MDPQIRQLLLSRIQEGQGAEKSLKDKLMERTAFVTGNENQLAGRVTDHIKNGINGVAVDPSQGMESYLGYQRDNTRALQGYSDNINALSGNTNSMVSQLAQLDQSQKNADRDYNLEQQKTTGVQGLLTLRKTLADAGVSTAQVDAELRKSGINPMSDEQGQSNGELLGIIGDLKKRGTQNITGRLGGDINLDFFDKDATNKRALVEQLKSKLSLNARKLLKGGGSISDAEQDMLKKSVSALDYKMDDKDFQRELTKIEGILSKAQGGGEKAKVGNYVIEEIK